MTITKRQVIRIFSKLKKVNRGGCDCAKDAYVCAYIIAEAAIIRKLEEGCKGFRKATLIVEKTQLH